MNEEPLVINESQKRHRRRLSNLPVVRFMSIASLFVAFDSLTCIALWLAGGDSLYLEDSVKDFSFTHSTFDLACIAAVRGVLLFVCLYYLENNSLLSISVTERTKQLSSSRLAKICQAMLLIVSSVSFVYAVVKGAFVIRDLVNGSSTSDIDPELTLHISYKVLCIVAVVFPGVELVLSSVSWWCVRRMIRTRQLRMLINDEEGDGGEGKKKSNADIKRIFLLAKPEYPILVVGLICLVISSASLSTAPFFFGKVIDYSIPRTNCSTPAEVANSTCVPYTMGRMNRIVLYLVAIFFVGCTAIMVRSIMFNLAGERFVARLRKKLFSAIVSQEMGFFDQNRTGELTNRLSADTQVIQNAVTENVSILARYVLQMFISIGLMFYISAKLTAVLLSVVPVIAISAVQYGRFLKSLRKQFQDKLANASSTAEESISNILTVRSFTNEEKMIGYYSEDIDDSYRLGRKLAFLIGVFMGVVSMLMYGAACLVLWYGGYLVYHQRINPGTLISLMLYTLNLAMCFAFLSNVYGEFMQAVGASVRIFELLDRKSLVKDGQTEAEPFKGDIRFDKVSFFYPSRPEEQVLDEVSFNVLPGQVVALVGPSGGGKSTIVKLIEHFYELSNGRITLGGYDIRELDPKWYRSHIGFVSQEPVLFATSIAKNISYGKSDATIEEIEEAAKQANAHEFITAFEQGYDTMVGERGVRLSGGQKQRVAIARALLLNPNILLLDEATSALDAESEHLVQEAIDRAMKGRTVLVIAHRLSTVRDASQVVVINKGQVAEQGTHDELLALGGVYKQLVLRQLTAGEQNGSNLSE